MVGTGVAFFPTVPYFLSLRLSINTFFVLSLLRATCALIAAGLFGQGDAEGDAEHSGNDDEDDDEEAPPLELAAVAGALVGLGDLLVARLEVVDDVLALVLGVGNDRLLLLDHGGELLVEDGELGEGLLDALEFVVAGADVAEEGGGVAGAVCAELPRRSC